MVGWFKNNMSQAEDRTGLEKSCLLLVCKS
jgi:hypothetical protein